MSITRHHAEWLSLIEISGPFLSLPVLSQAFPQGLHAHHAEQSKTLRLAFEEWDDNQDGLRPDPAIHREWIKWVLNNTLEYDGSLVEGQEIPQAIKADVAGHREVLRPDWVLNDPGTKKPRLLIKAYPRTQSLTKPLRGSRWNASPDTRMVELLRNSGTDVRLGMVTNGDQWMLVDAPRGETTGYASWYANLWFEEPLTQRAFRTLLSVERFFGVPDDETLEALLTKSAEDQHTVTDQLGYQVRRAVEVLVQSLDKADRDYKGKLLKDIAEARLYESALTVMMRLVFLFCAEERELLLLGDELYDHNYAVSTLREQLQETADHFGEEILGLRYDAWARLLTTFRAVYDGVQHQDFKLPAYGGHLFDPDRFPFLEGRKSGTSWRDTPAQPLPVSNQTVLHLLKSLQLLEVKMPGRKGGIETQKLSFRALDIEQIGHVYEGLLDHTAVRATEPVVGLAGGRDKEPEVPLSKLEELLAKGEDKLGEVLKKETGRSPKALINGLSAEIDDDLHSKFRTACQGDDELWHRIEPFAGLVRLDTFGYPVVIPGGSVYVTAGTDRRSSGTHYTPRSLTEPIVRYTLEPLVYEGPAEGTPKDKWKLKSPKELLDLKICDMACGSGAFLVQACRYMSERLLEAWEAAEQDAPGDVRITPFGEPSSGQPDEMPIPNDPNERIVYARRIVAQRCLYGVDVNPLASEMAKLSLWLLTLAKDKPFTFLDHSIRCGDSLVGISRIEQLEHFSLNGEGTQKSFAHEQIRRRIDAAKLIRQQLERIPTNTVEDIERKTEMLKRAEEQTGRLRYAADMLLAAYWQPMSDSEREQELQDTLMDVEYKFKDLPVGQLEAEAKATLDRAGCPPAFHWPLEFPEVFDVGGMSAFVGNPPFMHGSWISSRFGDLYSDFIRFTTPRLIGKVDYVIYFFRRAALLINATGVAGLILTDKAHEGDARKSGFAYVLKQGYSIIHSRKNVPWPGSAAVLVCLIHICRSGWKGTTYGSTLDEGGELPRPQHLAVNEGTVYLGAKPDSLGFVLSVEEAHRLVPDPTNHPVVKPYFSGSDLNDSPELQPPRFIIDFSEFSLEQAQEFDQLLHIVEEKVKPNRMTLKRKAYREKWWQFTEPQKTLFQTIRENEKALAVSRVSKFFVYRYVPSRWVYSDKVVVFARHSDAELAVLSSEMHQKWAVEFGGTHGSGSPEYKNYKPTECGRTFPLPSISDLAELTAIGQRFDEFRDAVFLDRREGPTPTYNRFHNPDESSDDIHKLRDLHVEMDNAVAAAYGWDDLDLCHGFHETKQGIRYTISEPARREVLQRLLKLNHERYEEEVRQGLHDKKKKTAKGKRRAKTKAKEGPTLF